MTVEDNKFLIEYKTILEKQILDLRTEACKLASKVRELNKLITPEVIAEVEAAEKVKEEWSLK